MAESPEMEPGPGEPRDRDDDAGGTGVDAFMLKGSV